MSSSDDQGGAGRREVAYRLFAAEFDDADFSYSESDEERAPNYVVTPTGARVNRLFVVGVLTEVETVSEDYLRARVVDPTGPFVVYAGQYQPEALAFLQRADPPTFVAVTGKARTYEPDDGNQVYTSIRPESISDVDAATRDSWVVQTAAQTVDRVGYAAAAKQTGLAGDQLRRALTAHGVDDGLAAGIPIALERYGTTGDYLSAIRSLALDASRVVAGERDEVDALRVDPGQGGDDVAGLVDDPIDPHILEEITAEPASADDGEPAAGSAEADEHRAATDDQRAGTAQAQQSAGAGSAAVTMDADASDEDGPTDTGGSETATAESELSADSTADATGADATSETGDAVETPAATGDDGSETGTGGGDELGDFDTEFELDDDEREEIESEYGTEFQSGTEVDDPGAADIETPDPGADTDADTERTEKPDEEPTSEPSTESADESAGTEPIEDDDAGTATTGTDESEDAAVATTEAAEDDDAGASDTETTASAAPTGAEDAAAETDSPDVEVDVEDAVMSAMTDLDDGDGASRTAVIDTVADRTGRDPGDVEAAIQDALMDGRCYEPDDETLKPI